MSLVQDEQGFRDLVIRHASQLPPQQRAIADYLLDHLQTVPFMSVPELAQRIGASEATIVRFAQRIGYNGFSELKMDLVELLQDRLGAQGEEAAPNAGDSVLDSVATLETGNIRRTLEALDRTAFSAVAEALFAADQVWTFGLGVSAILAELASYTLIQVGVRTSTLSTRFSSPREQLVTLREGDLVLVFSFPPYSRQTLDLLEEATRRGAATVAITDRVTAPAAAKAAHVLPVKSDNMMFTNAVAAVTVVFNALATEIATSHRGHALEALAHINRVLSDDDEVMPLER